MLREAIRHESVARRVLVDDHSAHFFRFFDYVQKANFDLASDAFDTFKMLLTRHKALAAQFLEANYEPVRSRSRIKLSKHLLQIISTRHVLSLLSANAGLFAV